MLAQGIAEWIKGRREQDYRLMALIVLAATSVTVKLGNLAFAAVIISFSLAYAWRISRPRIRGAVRILLPISILILVWAIQGFLLSGTPLYPSKIGYLPVKWAVPIENVVNQEKVMYGWARLPNDQWSDALASWNWLRPWSLNMSTKIVEVVYPLSSFVVFSIITVVIGALSFFKGGGRPRYLNWSILLPSILGLTLWFLTLPDLRYAHAFFFLLSGGSSLLLLCSLQTVLGRRQFLAAACAVFLLANLHFVVYAVSHSYIIKQVSRSGWYPVMKAPLNERVTSHGLLVYVPESGSQCWDSPLPCTPYFDTRLRLRRPGELGSGFTVRPPDAPSEQGSAMGGNPGAPQRFLYESAPEKTTRGSVVSVLSRRPGIVGRSPQNVPKKPSVKLSGLRKENGSVGKPRCARKIADGLQVFRAEAQMALVLNTPKAGRGL
jgi:MFS family permease